MNNASHSVFEFRLLKCVTIKQLNRWWPVR